MERWEAKDVEEGADSLGASLDEEVLAQLGDVSLREHSKGAGLCLINEVPKGQLVRVIRDG